MLFRSKYVNPTDVLFELINPSDIHLNLKIFEKDVSKLHIGQQLLAFNNNEPDNKHLCEILLISRNLNDNHTADVHCHFEKYEKNLLPGMYMNAEIELKSKESLTIPEDAVVNFEGKNYIFVTVDKHNFKMTTVTTGNFQNGFIEVLNADEFKNNKIVTKGAYTLLMKLKNKVDE